MRQANVHVLFGSVLFSSCRLMWNIHEKESWFTKFGGINHVIRIFIFCDFFSSFFLYIWLSLLHKLCRCDAIRLSLFSIPDECMLWVYCLLFAFLFVFFRLCQSLFFLKEPSPIVAFEFHNNTARNFSSARARCFNLLMCVFKRCLLYVLLDQFQTCHFDLVLASLPQNPLRIAFVERSTLVPFKIFAQCGDCVVCRHLGCHCVFVFSCIFLNFHLDN